MMELLKRICRKVTGTSVMSPEELEQRVRVLELKVKYNALAIKQLERKQDESPGP